jgi:hypothetical protein
MQRMQPTECLCADADVSELVFVVCPHPLLQVFQQSLRLPNTILAQFKNCYVELVQRLSSKI